MKYSCSFCLALILFFCKCSDVHGPRNVNQTIFPGFVRDVPIIKNGKLKGQEDPAHEYINREAFALQLDSLENGYDSLQLRIWLGHSMAVTKHVVIIKNRNKKWNGQLVSYRRQKENEQPEKKVTIIHPGSGWDIFIEKLYKLNIMTLASETDVSGYNGRGLDGISYEFETATPKMYRFYSYSNPQDNTSLAQAGDVLQIASLLEKEFDFTYTK